MKIRVIQAFNSRFEFFVGEELALPEREAERLIRKGWVAEADDEAGEDWEADEDE